MHLMYKLVFALLIGLYITSFSQDFIPGNVLVYLRYSNNMGDKFLPVWQNTIKNNKIKKETYISYDITGQNDRMPTPFDSTVFIYNSEGHLVSSVTTWPYPGAESAVKLTTNFRYENSYFAGSTDSQGNSLQIERDSKGRITSINFQGAGYKVYGKYHYTGEQLTMVELNPGEEGAVKIVYEENVFIAQDTTTGVTTIGDKYGRVNYVNSESGGLQTQYDPDERIMEIKLSTEGATETTSFLYMGELLSEIIFTAFNGGSDDELKDAEVTKMIKTEVQYE